MTPYQTPNAALLAALRTWVDSKEALERTNGSPSITREEVELISRLIRMKDATEADPGNCIGDLNREITIKASPAATPGRLSLTVWINQSIRSSRAAQ